MAHRYSVVIWQSTAGFQAVIPALGMAPVLAGTRRDAIRMCREVAQNRLTINEITGVPLPPDVKVSTEHVDIRDDGQVRSFSSQYVPCINTAMAQIVPHFASNPEAIDVVVEMFSEFISMLRETLPEASNALAGGPLSEAMWTPADLLKYTDELLDELVEFELSPEDGKQVRQVVQEHLSRELARVVPLDANLIGMFNGPLSLFGSPFDALDVEESFDELDISGFEPFLPPSPSALGPMQHPPRRKERKRS